MNIKNRHIFHYEHKEAEIAVSYVDKNGNELAPSATIGGKTLDEYTTEPVEVYGYEPVEIPDNAAGILHEDSDDVQYVYELKDSSLKVNYLDESGNEIAKNETINGKVFDVYSTNSKEFYGYILINEPDNASGTMAEENADVNYIYRKIFDKLPDEPYKAIYSDKLSDIELPFGWVFNDLLSEPDATVGNAETNTFNVTVPGDEIHSTIKGTVTIDVSAKTEPEQPAEPTVPTEPEEPTPPPEDNEPNIPVEQQPDKPIEDRYVVCLPIYLTS